jgi:hypothetical protein
MYVESNGHCFYFSYVEGSYQDICIGPISICLSAVASKISNHRYSTHCKKGESLVLRLARGMVASSYLSRHP